MFNEKSQVISFSNSVSTKLVIETLKSMGVIKPTRNLASVIDHARGGTAAYIGKDRFTWQAVYIMFI